MTAIEILEPNLKLVTVKGASVRGRIKSKGKVHLTALIEVPVSNFTYNFST